MFLPRCALLSVKIKLFKKKRGPTLASQSANRPVLAERLNIYASFRPIRLAFLFVYRFPTTWRSLVYKRDAWLSATRSLCTFQHFLKSTSHERGPYSPKIHWKSFLLSRNIRGSFRFELKKTPCSNRIGLSQLGRWHTGRVFPSELCVLFHSLAIVTCSVGVTTT